jgi:urease accessory protein
MERAVGVLMVPTSEAMPSEALISPGWQAELDLAFYEDKPGHTVLRHRHVGPLRIQKPLYPEGPGCCHAVVVHPPGGIAAGDELTMRAVIEPRAHGLITTPAATKWYGALAGGLASQTIRFDVQGFLEFLPAETIVFDQAHVCSRIDINIAPAGRALGWDLLIFGRSARGERFHRGCFDQTVSLQLDATPIWIDRIRLLGDDPLFRSPVGLGGHSAFSTFWAVVSENDLWEDNRLALLRQHVPEMAWSLLHERVLVGRQIGEPMVLRECLQKAWAWLKTSWTALPAQPLRLWAT